MVMLRPLQHGLRRVCTFPYRSYKGSALRLRECRLPARRHFKPAFDQIRVIEMAAPDERGRMGSPLTHGTGVADSHGPEHVPLTALSAGHESIGPEGTACSVIRSGQCAQIVIVGELIGDTGSIGIRTDIDDIVSPAFDAHDDSSRRRKRRQSQRRKGPFDGAFRCGQQLDPGSGKKHVVTAARMHGVVNERRTIDSESYAEYDPIESARV